MLTILQLLTRALPATSFVFHAYGHPRIQSTHPTTLEFTRNSHLTRRGDCIVGVSASHGLSDLPHQLRAVLSDDDSKCRVVITAGKESVTIEGKGARGLRFAHPTDLVLRKSVFLSDRTLMVKADKAAADLPRAIVKLLQDPKEKLTVLVSAWRDQHLPIEPVRA